MVIITEKNSELLRNYPNFQEFSGKLYNGVCLVAIAHGDTPAEAEEAVLDKLEYIVSEGADLLAERGRCKVVDNG